MPWKETSAMDQKIELIAARNMKTALDASHKYKWGWPQASGPLLMGEGE